MSMRKIVIPLIFTLLAEVVLLTLGFWQVQRLAWKEDLIATMEARVHAPAAVLPVDLGALDDWSYRHVQVDGTFDHDREAHVQATGPNGRAGFHVYTPLLMNDGRSVIINRGFVPAAFKEAMSRPESLTEGPQHITGLARLSRAKERFALNNNERTNIWFTPDVNEMAAFMGLAHIVPIFVDAADKGDGVLPLGGQTLLNIPNNHLDYALTWFALALVLLIVFLAYVRSALKRGDEHVV